MQRTVRLKLVGPTGDLDDPMARFAQACDFLAAEARLGACKPTFRALNAAYYRVVRARFGLTAQVAQTAERHVAGTFSTLKANGHADRVVRFRQPFLKLLAGRDWRIRDGQIVISVPGARLTFDVQARVADLERLLLGTPGGATLIKRGDTYYLNVCVALPDVPLHTPVTPIGIDRGIRTLAVARAPGRPPLVLRGGRVRDYRRRKAALRQRLQAVGTRSSRRVLRRIRRREQRFVLDQTRVAAKAIVEYAEQSPGAVLVLERLDGIRGSVRTRRAGRRDLHSWAFRLLQTTLANRAEERGIPLAFVDPAYTSRTCPKCGDARKANRIGLRYECLNCHYRNHADVVGASNIGRLWSSGTLARPRGRVNGPDECRTDGRLAEHAPPDLTLKPPTSVGGS